MTKKEKIVRLLVVFLVIGILTGGGVYVYSKYKKIQRISHEKAVKQVHQETAGEFGIESYEEYVGDGLFRNKGVAIIKQTKYNRAFEVYIEEDYGWVLKKESAVLISYSTRPLADEYLGKFVTLTYQKEYEIIGYDAIMCIEGPCPPPVAIYGPTSVVIKDIKEVTLSEEQKEQLAVALKGGVNAWAMYTDNAHGFSIKYPGHYFMSESKDGSDIRLGEIYIKINDGGKYLREMIGKNGYVRYEAVVTDQGVQLGKRIAGTIGRDRAYYIVTEFDHAGNHYFITSRVDYRAPERDEGIFKSIVETMRFKLYE
ncbi:MAG: hypothetical protein Q7S48_01490 [bacterium]|nr:hypothetical protein [bacterium]